MSPPAMEKGETPHVALLPSAGMGHLTPFLRLASALAARGCDVTLITPRPAVSAAEARHITDFIASTSPRIRPLDFHLLPFDPPSANATDPFLLQFEAIRRSAHLLGPLLASACPPLSAVVTDIPVFSAFVPVVRAAGVPNYVLFTASAAMLAFCAAFPSAAASLKAGHIDVPGLGGLPVSWIPPPLLKPGNLFAAHFMENGRALSQVDGIVVNTWEVLEGGTLAALNAGSVVPHLPPVIPVGPLPPVKGPHENPCIPWLEAQPERSVVYVSFGSRTALSAEQMMELGVGLEKSGCRFLWVVKSKKVDKEEEEGVSLEELLGDGFLRRVEGRGMVVKDWVDQVAILAHPAVGGFVSHCGWNSVTEAATCGVRLLAWPRNGDQRLNAWVVERGGLGTWPRGWSWEGEAEVVGGEEIAQWVRELMEGPGTGTLQEDAVRAAGLDGSSEKGLGELIAKWG